MSAQQFQKRILTWFDQHGRKDLPWQKNKTPYRVWVSEIMLQQTQVRTVIPYFRRFMLRFPTISALANAREDEVLHIWAGLGYYSRARMLHRSAQIIAKTHHHTFPATLTELMQLPGIGLTTAGAILAIAFDQSTTILDGNVKRVLARFHGITTPINEKMTENKLWELASTYTPSFRAADYTQAMMDMGAILCTRSNPQCHLCPLTENCSAHRQNIVEFLPAKKTPRKLPIRNATFLILKKGQQILLHKRPSSGIWGGLWSLPEISGQPDPATIRAYCQQHFQVAVTACHPLDSLRHTFSHYHLNIFPIMITIRKRPIKAMEGDQQIWYNPEQPKAIGLPKPIATILKALL